MTEHSGKPRLWVAAWGILGVLFLLGNALHKVVPFALEPLRKGTLTPLQLLLYVACVIFNAWAEGYRGFQRGFAPRVVARAFHLARHPRPLHVLLAPAYCMSYFHASRRGMIVAWSVTSIIALVVIGVRHVPQPWRGIIDAGVVVGLVWGAVAVAVFFVRAAQGHVPAVKINLPEPTPPATTP
ncbi:MAG: hypothetical protein WKG00_21155 [Polyangiaceae bacterium]